MHMNYSHPKQHQPQRWQRFWPTPFVAIIAIIQMLLTFAIVGLELWSMIINRKYSFFFIGFITSIFFTITWISTFTVVCCNRGSQGCATHALVEHILSIIASSVLIYFDAQILHTPLICLWPGYFCQVDPLNITWSNFWYYYSPRTQKTKLTAIKIQLVCAAIMLVTSTVFIGLFIYTCVKTRVKAKTYRSQQRIELNHRQCSRPTPISVWSAQQNLSPPSAPPPPYNFRYV